MNATQLLLLEQKQKMEEQLQLFDQETPISQVIRNQLIVFWFPV